MSTELKSQIRQYTRLVEGGQEPVTIDEIRARADNRDDTEPLLGPVSPARRLPLRGPWPAVVAAVVLLLLFGVLAIVLPSNEPNPPADSLPPHFERETTYYTTSAVPNGFVLQDMRTLGQSSLLFLREFEDTWLPTDGGFSIHGVVGRPFGLPEDPDAYLDETLEAVPGAIEIDFADRRGILYEIEFSQNGLSTPLIWVLAVDDQGGVFEIAALGMSRDEVLDVAEGVRRVPLEEFRDLEDRITWDVRITTGHNGFDYRPPSRVTDLADDVDMALGVDLLTSRLAHSGEETTVITTEDGEVVETLGRAIRSTVATHYLDVPPGGVDAALSAYPGIAELSPVQRETRVDQYLEQFSDADVISEDPYVIQASPGPEPRFDTGEFGEELPLVPAVSTDVLPDFFFAGMFDDRPAATEDRPVIVMGTAVQPDSDSPPVSVLVWFTETGVTCEGGSMGTGCGFEIGGHFGLGGPATTESDEGVLIHGEVTYEVPLETSVVQIVTESQSYWQRPFGGYGMIPFGDTVDRPTSITAFDADGNELGTWSVGSR